MIRSSVRPSKPYYTLRMVYVLFFLLTCCAYRDSLVRAWGCSRRCSSRRGHGGVSRRPLCRQALDPAASQFFQQALYATNRVGISALPAKKSNHDDGKVEEKDPFLQAVTELGYSNEQRANILRELTACAIWNDNSGSKTLISLTQDLMDVDSTAVSTLLIHDFGLSALTAHQTRAALQYVFQNIEQDSNKKKTNIGNKPLQSQSAEATTERRVAPFAAAADITATTPTAETSIGGSNKELKKSYYNGFKSVIINKTQQRRLAGVDQCFDYGLPKDYEDEFPLTASELQDFFRFMTVPSTDSQSETPIRPATANVYIRHAKLFLGWYWNFYMPEREAEEESCADADDDVEDLFSSDDETNLSIYKIFPTKEKESAASILAFLMWLRSTRNISVSYEANLLRGLTKLLKFRFCKESVDEDSSKSFDDIPVVRELRKWHRDANRRQAAAPRVSNEDRKWLSWPDYLKVVQSARADVRSLIEDHRKDVDSSSSRDSKKRKRKKSRSNSRSGSDEFSPQQRKIAFAFQKYLILAFFANVPDRQRTIRELEIGRSFVKDDQNQWCIRHAPEDYKTGSTYGERPPLHLPVALTAEIDEFIEQWRPCLRPRNKDGVGGINNHLFVQSRTGNPLTQDSVYHNVAHTCYKYTGQKTNPHLLRDMIVTHVRESSNASEQQLEALALFMGHSVQIQRQSYDRRTLTKKVAPAVALMEQVNSDNLSQ